MKIFMSYSRRDRAVAKEIASDLRLLDHEVWIDDEIAAGANWWSVILQEIRSAQVLVFVLSSDSLQSSPCLAELDYAVSTGLPVLPIAVSKSLEPAMCPWPLRVTQWLFYMKRDKEDFVRLLRSFKLLKAPSERVPVPEPPAPLLEIAHLREIAEQAGSIDGPIQYNVVDQLRLLAASPASEKAARSLLSRMATRTDLLDDVVAEMNKLLMRIKHDIGPQSDSEQAVPGLTGLREAMPSVQSAGSFRPSTIRRVEASFALGVEEELAVVWDASSTLEISFVALSSTRILHRHNLVANQFRLAGLSPSDVGSRGASLLIRGKLLQMPDTADGLKVSRMATYLREVVIRCRSE